MAEEASGVSRDPRAARWMASKNRALLGEPGRTDARVTARAPSRLFPVRRGRAWGTRRPWPGVAGRVGEGLVPEPVLSQDERLNVCLRWGCCHSFIEKWG